MKEQGMARSIVDFIVMLAIAAACVFLLRTFVILPFSIPSGSMETTIMPGDMVFSEKITTRDGVEPGEVVTFADPQDSSRTLIKRVIATGGQTVDLIDGMVYVDGSPVNEVHAMGDSLPLQTADGVELQYPLTVPEGYLWVMGDNREASLDSRYFGAVPESSVSGHAFMIYWPLNHAGLLS